MRTIYVFDTSVLLYDPHSYQSFPESDLVIPVNVLDELDKLKTFPNQAGKNARIFIRFLDEVCALGPIHKGVEIENGINIKVDTENYKNEYGDDDYTDNKILACAVGLKAKNKKKPVILLSRDINLRIRGRAFELIAQDYDKDNLKSSDEIYPGYQVIQDPDLGELLKSKNSVDCGLDPELKALNPNECVYITDEFGNGLALGKKIGNKIHQIESKNPWGLGTKNKEQAMAVDLVMDPRISLVTLLGRAGTGKTLLAIACALELVLEKKKYSKIIIYRPIETVGKDLGYLPGSLAEKLAVWMQPVMDSFEFLLSTKKNDKWKTMFELYQSKGIIQLEALTYIRGRSIPNALIILEEAQNIDKETAKTILTRLGPGSKILITGDIEQIDANNLDASNNGLSYIVEKFKDSDLAGHITFEQGVRSPLATKASEIL